MTRDQRWVLRMTQKPKHRWLKVLIQRSRDITSVIKYHGCNMLYKLHLLKRFSYISEDERFVHPLIEDSVPHHFKVVQCRYSASLYDHEVCDIDYFYYGNKKIVHVVRNDLNTTHLIRLTLKDVALVLDGEVYMTKLPEVRVAIPYVEAYPIPVRQDWATRIPKFKTVNYDIGKLRKLMCEQVVNDPYSPEEVQFAFGDLSGQMSEILSKLSFRDLEVKE